MNKALIALITIWAIIVLITVYLLSNQIKRVDGYYEEVKEMFVSILKVKEPNVIVCNFENGECFGDWEEYEGDEEFNK